jgi:hypothetical protein
MKVLDGGTSGQQQVNLSNYLVPRLDPSAAVGCGAMRLENGDSSRGYRVTY